MQIMLSKYRTFVFIAILFVLPSKCENNFNKYSKEANIPKEDESFDFKRLENPFRMAKCNLVWAKSVQVKMNERKPKYKYLYKILF